MVSLPARPPACHVFAVGPDFYAYDLNTQQILAVEPELARALRGEKVASRAARAALRRAQADEGLFLPQRPQLVPWQAPPGPDVEKDLQHLVLTVTESCNLRCRYCLHGADLGWMRPHGTEQMSVETALKAVAYFLERRDPERKPVISFYGGEALLNWAVVTAVVAAAREHPQGTDTIFAIDTNGVLLDDGAIGLVVSEKIFLQISIDGPAASHDRHRRDMANQPTHARIMANIGRVLDRDPTAVERLAYVVTLAPPVDLLAVADLFSAFPPYVGRGITTPPKVTVNFANLKNQGWAEGQEKQAGLPPVSEQLDRARATYLEAFSRCGLHTISPVIRALFEPELIRFHNRGRRPLGKAYTPGANCHPGRRKLHVTIDGRLQPCERTGDVMSLGTIVSGISLHRVKHLYASFHEAVRDRCGQCWALRMCNVCFAAQAENIDQTTGELTVPESVCQRVRAQKEDLLKMMVKILALTPEARAWLDETELS